MFRKLPRAMMGDDLAHDFLLHKTPRPISGSALVGREELFDAVVIQRGWRHVLRLRSERHHYARYSQSLRPTSPRCPRLNFNWNHGNISEPLRDFNIPPGRAASTSYGW